MKIEGKINIMGIKEVVFQQKVGDKFYEIVNYIKLQDTWVRVGELYSDRFCRTHDEMMKSIKSLAYNPVVELTFSDGVMYVNFLNPKIAKEDLRSVFIFQPVDFKGSDFKRAWKELMHELPTL